nr:hypothetical protein GCM10020093_089040 [Planobispora longispora]
MQDLAVPDADRHLPVHTRGQVAELLPEQYGVAAPIGLTATFSSASTAAASRPKRFSLAFR